jgi:hypothetical protein
MASSPLSGLMDAPRVVAIQHSSTLARDAERNLNMEQSQVVVAVGLMAVLVARFASSDLMKTPRPRRERGVPG